jgi:predicted RNA-binding protein YlxR (DUF448 family)
VAARQEGIDPVGSCVGVRGVRIQNIVNELNGEKIDVVEWSEDPSQYVANALSPAQVSHVTIDEATRTAKVIVPERQLSLAIGKEGQNARLAAKLTGWRIDIKSDVAMAAAQPPSADGDGRAAAPAPEPETAAVEDSTPTTPDSQPAPRQPRRGSGRGHEGVIMRGAPCPGVAAHVTSPADASRAARRAKRGLVRIVRVRWLGVDRCHQARSGRGAYLCHTPECWRAALKRGVLPRALKLETIPEDDLQTLIAYAEQLSAAPTN